MSRRLTARSGIGRDAAGGSGDEVFMGRSISGSKRLF